MIRTLLSACQRTLRSAAPVLLPMLLLFVSSCEKEPYDDDQYGDNCVVVESEVKNFVTRTLEYDQYNRVIRINANSSMMPPQLMEVTYNNNTAFIEFYSGGTRVCDIEAPLNADGNMLSATATDSTGSEIAYMDFTYDASGRIIKLSGRNAIYNTEDTITISWVNNNATSIQRATGSTIHCTYYTGQKNSFSLGVGNVALLFYQQDADIVTIYSQDLLKVYDTNSAFFGPIEVSYDFDSQDKIRKIFSKLTQNGVSQTSTNLVSYECD